MPDPFHIGFPVFSHVTQLDLTGPAQLLSRLEGVHIHVVSKALAPVMTDAGFALVPTDTFDDCPDLDLLCVPGGAGQAAVMGDASVLDWLRRQGAGARWVTSVCTGSLILGAAGLLRGYRAASHWAHRDKLAKFGAIPVAERVVTDRNRITGGGVTAGIDLALAVIEAVRGRAAAEAIQLAYEYAPSPSFDCGIPERATPETIAAARAILQRMSVAAEAARIGNGP